LGHRWGVHGHHDHEDAVGGKRARHLATLVISPSTKAGTRSGMLSNHYSLLGTAEQLLGLSKLGLATAYPTMTKPFNL
jgi:hypothetical protein